MAVIHLETATMSICSTAPQRDGGFSSQTTPDILDTAGAAEYLKLSTPTLERFRLSGGGPTFAKLTPGPRGSVRYRRADLDAWMASRLVRSTSETSEARKC